MSYCFEVTRGVVTIPGTEELLQMPTLPGDLQLQSIQHMYSPSVSLPLPAGKNHERNPGFRENKE